MTGYSDYYSSLSSYFSQSGGTNSPGKSGGAGYNNDMSTGGTNGDKQSASAQSGSGWISAAASTNQDDKSSFSTPFFQSFGGITNNQIIQSPGASNAAAVSPINAPPVGIPVPGASFAANLSPVWIAVIAAIVGAFALKHLK